MTVPLLGLLITAAALAGTIGWELSGVVAPRRALPAQSAEPNPALAATPAGVTNLPVLAATTLSRPLFTPDRRPPVAVAMAGAAPAATLPRLSGTLVTATGRSAVFAAEPRPVIVQEGQTIAGYTVSSIKPGLVTLQGPGGARLLRPSFDTARPAAAPIPPPLPLDAGLPPPPRTSPTLPDGPKDTMPFDQKPAPSGMDILRNLAPQQ